MVESGHITAILRRLRKLQVGHSQGNDEGTRVSVVESGPDQYAQGLDQRPDDDQLIGLVALLLVFLFFVPVGAKAIVALCPLPGGGGGEVSHVMPFGTSAAQVGVLELMRTAHVEGARGSRAGLVAERGT